MINLIIRTYNVNNLYQSLFKLPEVIDSSMIDIYIHNDNPDTNIEFLSIITEFKSKYSDYSVSILQEIENQGMFMSIMNTIPLLKDNKYTMFLDDDDNIVKFSLECLTKLESLPENICIGYIRRICYLLDNNEIGFTNCYLQHLHHRIYTTKCLKNIYNYKNKIVDLLVRYNDTIKFNRHEDLLWFELNRHINGCKEYVCKDIVINYLKYEHIVNGYVSTDDILANFPEIVRCTKVIKHVLNGIGYEYDNILLKINDNL